VPSEFAHYTHPERLQTTLPLYYWNWQASIDRSAAMPNETGHEIRPSKPPSENTFSQALSDFRGQKITSELPVTRAKYRGVARAA
jgi:hypothetical protein